MWLFPSYLNPLGILIFSIEVSTSMNSAFGDHKFLDLDVRNFSLNMGDLSLREFLFIFIMALMIVITSDEFHSMDK